MKKIFFLFIICTMGVANAQSANEVAVKRLIDMYFDGFNERDSVKIQRALSEDIEYQVVEELFGSKVLKDEDLSDVIKAIVTMPKTTEFEIKNSKVIIHAGDQIATAWTETQFYLYGSYYQCGSSAFQLAKVNGDWKIISLLDNYSKENCATQN